MERNEKIKELRNAMNGRLLLLFVGIMLIVNGITASGRTGIGWFSLARQVTEYQAEDHSDETAAQSGDAEVTAEPETAAAQTETEPESGALQDSDVVPETEMDIAGMIRQMEQIGFTTADLRMFGIAALIAAVAELAVGIICVILSNRVDRSKITQTAIIVLLVVEVVYMVFLLLHNALSLGVLFNALLLPLVLLWAVRKLRKLAKDHPDMIYAVEPARQAPKRMDPVPKKSLKERAGMNTRVNSKEEE